MTSRSLLSFDAVPTLALFLDVVEAGSFSAAARRRGLTTSAVSKRIAQLEDRLGAPLLHRTTRRLALSDAGLRLRLHAERALRELEEAEGEIGELSRAPRGLLRVATSVSFGQMHMGTLASEFVARHRDVTIELSLEERFVDLVAERFDLGIRCGTPGDSSLKIRRLAPSRRVLCASPAYLRERGEPSSPADLELHNCLRHALEDAGRTWVFDARPKPVQVRVRGTLRADNALVLRDAAIKGIGIALLPNFLVADDVRAGRLHIILDGLAAKAGHIYAVQPPSRQPSRLARAFIAHLAERLPALIGRL
ncbi:MAG: LysR family transcriptional regulator [Polyangiaceae bacterium]|nr:LysR family transcriptional regulator [Polyangiaceae bacterium]